VQLPKKLAKLPATAQWREGPNLYEYHKANPNMNYPDGGDWDYNRIWKQNLANGTWPPPGTAVATFINGRYPGPEVRVKHGALFAGYFQKGETSGIVLFEQWAGNPPTFRALPWNHDSRGLISNDPTRFNVILLEK
ncbi:MAG: BPSL0067 family protein, partial [bacterium]